TRFARKRYGSEQLEISLGVRLRCKHGAIDAEGLHGEGLGDHGLVGQDMATASTSVRFGPQGMAMKERRAVALAKRHRRQFEPRDARRPEGFAVTSSRPRASSSSRTSRFGTLP